MQTSTLRLAGWGALGVLVAAIATMLQFRHGVSYPGDLAWSANGPRWLLGFAAGALLGGAGCHLPERARAPHLWLAVSAGAALGAALGWLLLGGPAAVAGALLGAAALGIPSARWIRGSWGAALLCTVCAGFGVLAVSLVKAEPTLGRELALWAVGNVAQATWIGASLAVVLLGVTVVLRSPWLAMGAAVGLAGPMAFVAWWVPAAEQRIAGLHGAQRSVLCGIAGGVLVLSVDTAQRFLVGGYALGLNLPLTLLGVPFLLWWGPRSWAKRLAGMLAALLGLTFSAYVTGIIQSAT